MKVTSVRDLCLLVTLLFGGLGCFNNQSSNEFKCIDMSCGDNTFEEGHSIVYDSPSSERSHSSLDESTLNDLEESMVAEVAYLCQAIDQARY